MREITCDICGSVGDMRELGATFDPSSDYQWTSPESLSDCDLCPNCSLDFDIAMEHYNIEYETAVQNTVNTLMASAPRPNNVISIFNGVDE